MDVVGAISNIGSGAIDIATGGIVGMFGRLIPFVVDVWDRRSQRAHELAMMDKQEALDRRKFEEGITLEKLKGELKEGLIHLQGMIDLNKKMEDTSDKYPSIYFLNKAFRPFAAFWWCIFLYTLAMGLQVYLIWFSGDVQAGMSMEAFAKAFLTVWGPDEKAIVGMILGFFFINRAITGRFSG